MRKSKVQTSLRFRSVPPEPIIFVYISGKIRENISQRTRHVTLLRGRTCVLKDVPEAFFLAACVFRSWMISKCTALFANSLEFLWNTYTLHFGSSKLLKLLAWRWLHFIARVCICWRRWPQRLSWKRIFFLCSFHIIFLPCPAEPGYALVFANNVDQDQQTS